MTKLNLIKENLVEELNLLKDKLVEELDLIKDKIQALYARHPSFFKGLLYSGLGLVVLSVAVTLFCFTKFSPIVDRRLNGEFKQSARIYAAVPDESNPKSSALRDGGGLINEEPNLMANAFDASRARKRLVRFEDIPKTVIAAVVSGEDRIFFKHHGINPKRIVGALISDFKQRAPSQGASTITQQLARSLFLTREPTLRRKISEAMIAMILERRLSKEEIFTMYANEIYLGQRDSFAIHGFAEAAKAYFGKDLQQVTLSEAAMLAGIIPAPNAYSPVQHLDRATVRRDLILRILFESKSISNEEYEKARQDKLKIAPGVDAAEGQYLVDYVQDELRETFPEKSLMAGGLKVYTTVDLRLQKAALDAVAQGLTQVREELAKRNNKSDNAAPSASPQAGLIALDPRTGEIKAMVGGTHYGATQYNRITQALRQPGSIFKPIVYAAALETALEGIPRDVYPEDGQNSALLSPVTMLLDQPTAFSLPQGVYAPKDFGDRYAGPVSLRTAFQRSLNIPAVSLAQVIGFERVVGMARRLGLNPKIRAYPSVALGAFEVTPLEMAGAYTAFANGGRRVEPHAIRRIASDDGQVLKDYKHEPRNVFSPQLAYLMTHLMEGVLNYGTGAGVRARGFQLPAAGKTGTSRDGWFAGYTKDLLVLTWVGFDDGHDLKLEGSRSALPIWTTFMKKAYQIYPPRDMAALRFSPPSGIEIVRIDSATLLRGDPSCGSSFEEAFVAGTAPTASCADPVVTEEPSPLDSPDVLGNLVSIPPTP